ncbi:MAG TPA: flagellar basal body protein [Tepidisphaeraceae bacterium]|jgi:flagellar hook protein FlgE|nr:flagellar basal body protein [Tepidisphaeraceae bacterium]
MDVFNIALSGLQAAQTQLNVTANNVANLDTPGYQAQRADLVDLSPAGVAVSGISRDQTPGPVQSDGTQGSNVDLATEMVNLTRGQLLYSANAAVLRVGQKMTGALLDMFDNRPDV